MEIGCQRHPLKSWDEFSDSEIAEMDGKTALRFWRENKQAILALARATGREF